MQSRLRRFPLDSTFPTPLRRSGRFRKALVSRRAGRGEDHPRPGNLAWMIEAQVNLNGDDCEPLFTTPTGRMWRARNFYRDLWKSTQQASGLGIRPHERHHS